jgi:hypothetical protein
MFLPMFSNLYFIFYMPNIDGFKTKNYNNVYYNNNALLSKR